MSKTAKALVRAAVSRTIAMGVTLVVGMVLVPMTVHHLGDRLYGAWVFVGIVLGYYGLLDLGLSSSISRFVSRALGQSNKNEADGIITTGLYLFSTAGSIIIAITVIVVLLCNRFVHDPEEAMLFRIVFLVMGVSLGLNFPSNCYRGVLEAHLRYDASSIIDICGVLIRAALFVWVLLHGGKLLALALVAAAVDLSRGAAIIILAQRIHGRTRLSTSLVTRARMRTLLEYGFFTFLAQVSDLLRQNVYPFIISGFLGLAAVTPYSIAEQVRGFFTRLAASILSTLSPVFSRQEGKKNEETIRWSYFFTYKISCYVGVFLVGIAAILGGDFVLRWVGEKYVTVIPILYILLVGCFFSIIQIPAMSFLYGTSRNRFYAITNAVEGITNITLSIILIRMYGLVGMAFGALIASVLNKALLLPWWVCRALNVSLLKYYLYHTLPNVVKPALFMGVAFVTARYFLAADYVRLAMVGLTVSLLFVPYIFFIGFNPQQRALLLRTVRRTKSVAQPPVQEET